MAAPTALTAQNTRGVSAVHLPPAGFVAEQIRMVFADIAVAAVKIGMLGSREIVEAVADALAPHPDVPIVLDPVLVSTSGATLGDDAVIAAMRARLFPRAMLVTPNLSGRRARLAGTATRSSRDAEDRDRRASRFAAATGEPRGLIKGGHRDRATAD